MGLGLELELLAVVVRLRLVWRAAAAAAAAAGDRGRVVTCATALVAAARQVEVDAPDGSNLQVMGPIVVLILACKSSLARVFRSALGELCCGESTSRPCQLVQGMARGSREYWTGKRKKKGSKREKKTGSRAEPKRNKKKRSVFTLAIV
jgi:hypothetical protein